MSKHSISTAIAQSSTGIRHHHPNLTERNLPLQLTIAGFQILWQNMDIVVGSLLAHYRTTEFYQEMIVKSRHGEWRGGPTVQNCMIMFGVFRLWMAVTVGHELPLDFIFKFAEFMLVVLKTVTVVMYHIVAFTAKWSITVTMMIMDSNEQNIVGGGLLG